MKTKIISRTVYGAVLAALLVCVRAQAGENTSDAVDIVRSIYKSDRQSFVTDALQLTEKEGETFWPLYKSYRADIDKIGDELVKLVLEYADRYPNITGDDAKRMLDQYLALEKKLSGKREYYFKRASKKVPAEKALRWAQVENRMDLLLRLQMASVMPIVPVVKP